MNPILQSVLIVLTILLLLSIFGLRGLLYTCAPNEVLIFSGRKRREGGQTYGFRLMKGGTGFRIPLVERVDRMDLTNIIIDMTATNAYSKGGIPLIVAGVANVKIAGHEPLLNHAIERFLGRNRAEITQVAKATLEGSLRGILATMTPEQVNEDKIMFAERLVSEVEQDMTALGLVVDTMKIQNVQDEVMYLESLGRQRGAEVVSKARIAEALAKADSAVRTAENLEREQRAAIGAQVEIAKAEAGRRLAEVTSRREALVAEEQSQVAALVAQARGELEVQKARVEQVRQQLEADVIAPASAAAAAMEAKAKADTAPIIEDGRARAEALRKLAETWKSAGPQAKQVMLSQKLDTVLGAISDMVPETKVDKALLLNAGSGGGTSPASMMGFVQQFKSVFGVDLVDKLKDIGSPRPIELNVSPVMPKAVE